MKRCSRIDWPAEKQKQTKQLFSSRGTERRMALPQVSFLPVPALGRPSHQWRSLLRQPLQSHFWDYHNCLTRVKQPQGIGCWEGQVRGLIYSVVVKFRHDAGDGAGTWCPHLLGTARNRKWWCHHRTHQPDNSMGHQKQQNWPHLYR